MRSGTSHALKSLGNGARSCARPQLRTPRADTARLSSEHFTCTAGLGRETQKTGAPAPLTADDKKDDDDGADADAETDVDEDAIFPKICCWISRNGAR